MLRLDLERELPCSPARAWPLISEPALMNLWSSARIEAVSAGDGGHPGGTGAVRRVHLRRRPRTTLVEIVERLLHQGDDRGHFARVLQHVTEDLGALVDNERFDHPGWILRLVPILHRAYEDNLLRRLGERDGAVADHWARAFDDTEGAR